MLSTLSKNPNWNRTVPLSICHNIDSFSNINLNGFCAIFFLVQGSFSIYINNTPLRLSASSILLLNPFDNYKIQNQADVLGSILFFQPTVLNEKLCYSVFLNENEKNTLSSTDYQDFCLLQPFFHSAMEHRKISCDSKQFYTLSSCLPNIDRELTLQYNDFWPCRSRSYFIQLLSYLNNFEHLFQESLPNSNAYLNNTTYTFYLEIVNYLNSNYNQNISLSLIEKEFGINRNKINILFHTFSSTTLMKNLTEIRINMACQLLRCTELPIYEIALRIGFSTESYFSKAFKKAIGTSPLAYRQSSH